METDGFGAQESPSQTGRHRSGRTALTACAAVVIAAAWGGVAYNLISARGGSGTAHAASPERFKTVEGRDYLWVSGPRDGPASQWLDITGSPLDKDGFQYGIGLDTIRSIDDPVYVKPDDPRLLVATGRQRNIDGIHVFGYADGDTARAYPIDILNRHELVNDTINGKPVTVGW